MNTSPPGPGPVARIVRGRPRAGGAGPRRRLLGVLAGLRHQGGHRRGEDPAGPAAHHRGAHRLATDADTRGKLAFVLEARRFAADELGIDVGDAYTTYTKLEHDTLALVLSAAYKDRLVPKTWWFPIVGRVPYKGFFERGRRQGGPGGPGEGRLRHLPSAHLGVQHAGLVQRPAAVHGAPRRRRRTSWRPCSTSWPTGTCSCPARSASTRASPTFVGRAAAVRFFCTRQGGGPDTVKCLRAQARWRDYQRFSVFVDGLVDDLQTHLRTHATSTSPRRSGAARTSSSAPWSTSTTTCEPTFEALGFRGFRNIAPEQRHAAGPHPLLSTASPTSRRSWSSTAATCAPRSRT